MQKFMSGLLLSIAFLCSESAVADSRIEYLGKPTKLSITELKTDGGNGLMRVQAIIENPGAKPRTAYYRFRWLDGSGFDVGREENWKPLLVQANQHYSLQAVAPTKTATDFRLQFSAEDNYSSKP